MPQLILEGGIVRRGLLKKLISKMELGPYFLMSSLVLFVVLVTVIALVFSTRQVTKGYVLNKLESQHQELLRQSEKQQMEISQVRSLQFIEESRQVSSMVRPNQIVFMSGETAIASR
jgi:hypothetical protein